jgi:hypothetical protein
MTGSRREPAILSDRRESLDLLKPRSILFMHNLHGLFAQSKDYHSLRHELNFIRKLAQLTSERRRHH